MRWLLLVSALCLIGCHPIAVSPSAPTLALPGVVADHPPPVLPTLPPVELSLSIGRDEVYAGEGVSIYAAPVKGALFGPAVYTWQYGDGTSDTTERGNTGHVYASGGDYTASVRVRDRDGTEAAASTVVTVTRRPSPPREPPPPPPPPPCPTITLSPATLPNGTVGTNYTRTITASGGKGPYGVALSSTSGPLPAGLLLARNGVLSGSPTTAGLSTFVVDASDTAGCRGARSYTVTIADKPGVMTAAMSCTATSLTTHTAACNISGTYNGAPVPSATITRVEWDWDDGTTTTSTAPGQTHLYTQPGTWTVIAAMTATTADGPRTATASKTVTVPRPPPTTP